MVACLNLCVIWRCLIPLISHCRAISGIIFSPPQTETDYPVPRSRRRGACCGFSSPAPKCMLVGWSGGPTLRFVPSLLPGGRESRRRSPCLDRRCNGRHSPVCGTRGLRFAVDLHVVQTASPWGAMCTVFDVIKILQTWGPLMRLYCHPEKCNRLWKGGLSKTAGHCWTGSGVEKDTINWKIGRSNL